MATVENLPPSDGSGERIVFYEWCVSLIFVTLRRPSRFYHLRSNQWGILRGLPYTLLTLFLGWWAIPWGLVYTPIVLWTNLSGGRVVTKEEWARQKPDATGREQLCEPS
jgi:hypothetical protein